MSKIINPSTGRPNPEPEKVSQEDLLRIMAGHKGKIVEATQRIEGLHQNMIQLGLYTEYLYEQIETNFALLMEKTGIELKVDHEAFPDWANARYAQMREDAKKIIADGLDDTTINLDEAN